MTTPISNDKILSSDSSNGAVTGKKQAEQETTTHQSGSSGTVPQDKISAETSSVDIDRANQLYSRTAPKPSSGEHSIFNQEQAMAAAAEIRIQIEENGQQALKAHTGSSSGSLAVLLESAPV